MARFHGNSNQNKRKHHLYAIHDRKTREVFKYGISQDPLTEDGTSKRVRTQLSDANLLVGWLRFFARILVWNIPGKKAARVQETLYIEEYRRRKGRKPRGNR